MSTLSDVEPLFLTVSEDIRVKFPQLDETVSQDKEFCMIHLDGIRRRIRFHDYGEIYSIPGLYEKIFYEHLGCCSPEVVTNLFRDVLKKEHVDPSTLSVFEIGAGNGMVGECLQRMGVNSIVGVDILIEAKLAAYRDRPEVYDDYLAIDLTHIPESIERRLAKQKMNTLVSVAALGFGDLPPYAYAKAFNLIEEQGWIAFNIKKDFLEEEDPSGFHSLIHKMIHQGIMQIQEKILYKHRNSIDGKSLNYLAIVAKKTADIPGEWLETML